MFSFTLTHDAEVQLNCTQIDFKPDIKGVQTYDEVGDEKTPDLFIHL